MKINKSNPAILALSTALALGVTSNVSAIDTQNPLAVSDLGSGYTVAAGHKGKEGHSHGGDKMMMKEREMMQEKEMKMMKDEMMKMKEEMMMMKKEMNMMKDKM